MTDLQLEQQILGYISNNLNYTMFLLKQKFPSRQHNKLKNVFARLEIEGKLHLNEDLFIRLGPKQP